MGRSGKALALTFDDGPGEATPPILDCLERHGAAATFFVLGRHVSGREAVVRRLLDPDPARRYPSARRLQKELVRCMRRPAPPDRPADWLRRPLGPIWQVGLITTLLVLMLVSAILMRCAPARVRPGA